MQMMSNMVLDLPSISSTKGVCEGCVLGKHHKKMFDKGKYFHAKELLQLIHSNICASLETLFFVSLNLFSYFY